MSVEALIAATETKAAAATPAATPAATEPEVKPVVTPAEEPKPGEVKPAEGQPEIAQAETAVEETTEINLDEVPETSGDFPKYKELFRANPELRQIVGREKAFSELGNFSDVREIVSRIPTVEDAETLTEQAENARSFGETFRGDRTKFVESLKESDPLAFQALVSELPEILASTDEKLYIEQARTFTNRVMTNTLALAQQSGDAELLKAVQIVAQYLGVQHSDASPRTADTSEAARLRKQIADRDKSDANQAFESFWNSTDEVIIGNTVSEIDRTLKQALPNATEKQLSRISREVYSKTLEMLNAQPQFRQQLDSFRANAMKGRQGIADHKALVDFATRRAKLVIPKVAKDVISEWSSEILKLDKETLDKKKQIAASTKDVGSGPQGTTSAASTQANGGGGTKPRHVSDVFTEIENRNYVKR